MDGVDEPCSPTPPTGHQHQSGHVMCYEGRTSSCAIDTRAFSGLSWPSQARKRARSIAMRKGFGTVTGYQATTVGVDRIRRDQLLDLIATRRAKVSIIGLGYVGLPLTLAAVKAGFCVLGFDTDQWRVSQLNRGHSSIKHIS